MSFRKTILITAVVVLLLSVIYLLWQFKPVTDITPPLLEPVTEEAEPLGLIGAQYDDVSLFLSPIKQSKTQVASGTVTGIIVPHHLLAKDLSVKPFAYAAAGKYSRIVLLSPDHFSAGAKEVSVAPTDFLTVFGQVETDQLISDKLRELAFVGEGDFFYREHGLQAVLPFIKYYFPEAAVTAITFKPTVSKSELDEIINALVDLLPSDSLIIQSTDFSHYLSPQEANQRDQETLNILGQDDFNNLLSLHQPENIDSLAAMYVQANLQKNFYASSLNILGNRNSQDYTSEVVASSTSYFAGAYLKDLVPTRASGSAELIFVGDVMLSRHIGEIMTQRQDYNFPFALIKPYLSTADSVFGNLEGPIASGGKSVGSLYSFRANPLAISGLKEAGFRVLSVANNHAFDYGRIAFAETLDNLQNTGLDYTGGGRNFQEAHRGAYQEINGVRITYLAYTGFLSLSNAAGEQSAGIAYLDLKQMAQDIENAKKYSDLVVTSFHWGQEYQTRHDKNQELIAQTAINAGADLIIGHHPHVAQELGEYQGVPIAYSLGNFIFDQNFSLETSTGLVLRVVIRDKKIVTAEKQIINFNRSFQPYITE